MSLTMELKAVFLSYYSFKSQWLFILQMHTAIPWKNLINFSLHDKYELVEKERGSETEQVLKQNVVNLANECRRAITILHEKNFVPW